MVGIGGDECFDDNDVSEFVVGVVQGGVLQSTSVQFLALIVVDYWRILNYAEESGGCSDFGLVDYRHVVNCKRG